MVEWPSLSWVLVGFGVFLLVLSAAPLHQSTDVKYAHEVTPAGNGSLVDDLGYQAGDVVTYENLSQRGQAAFDRARTNSRYAVENRSATASDFDYTSDNVDIGHGAYPIWYSGKIYSLQTKRQTAGFNAALWFLLLLSRGARDPGAVLVLAGVSLGGWRWYRN